MILAKTAFFREAAGDSSRSPRKERRDAGCYQLWTMSRKIGRVDRLQDCSSSCGRSPCEFCKGGGRFPQCWSVPDAHVVDFEKLVKTIARRGSVA